MSPVRLRDQRRCSLARPDEFLPPALAEGFRQIAVGKYPHGILPVPTKAVEHPENHQQCLASLGAEAERDVPGLLVANLFQWLPKIWSWAKAGISDDRADRN